MTSHQVETLFDDVRPDYWVKSMATRRMERDGIGQLGLKPNPPNGLVAVSTFSGCGGSSLGLWTAGFTIPYAVEFTPQGAATYRANFPTTYVDERDIREIEPAEILDRIGLEPGELDLFEGSPPCSSFSGAGTAKSGQFGETRGKVKNYSGGKRQATDDLFMEWVRLIEGIRPKAVLAENVPDMLKNGDARKFTFEVQQCLGELGYEVFARVYSSLNVGTATMRRRLIFMGVRRDVGQVPRPTLSGNGYTLAEGLRTLPVEIPADELDYSWTDGTGKDPETGDSLPHCEALPGTCNEHYQYKGRCAYAMAELWEKLPYGTWHQGEFNADGKWYKRITMGRAAWDKPCPTLTATGATAGAACVHHPDECRRFTATEIKWLSGFPPDFVLTGTPRDRYERIARAVTPPLYEEIGRRMAEAIKGGV